jgi:hypothetical protein
MFLSESQQKKGHWRNLETVIILMVMEMDKRCGKSSSRK